VGYVANALIKGLQELGVVEKLPVVAGGYQYADDFLTGKAGIFSWKSSDAFFADNKIALFKHCQGGAYRVARDVEFLRQNPLLRQGSGKFAFAQTGTQFTVYIQSFTGRTHGLTPVLKMLEI
jgi:hypothetical protein